MSASSSHPDDEQFAETLRTAGRKAGLADSPAYSQALEDRIMNSVRAAASEPVSGESASDAMTSLRDLVEERTGPARSRRSWAAWTVGGLLALAPVVAWIMWAALSGGLPTDNPGGTTPGGTLVQTETPHDASKGLPESSPPSDEQFASDKSDKKEPAAELDDLASPDELSAAADIMSLAYVVLDADVEEPGLGELRDDARVALVALLDEFRRAGAAYEEY